MKEQKGAVPWEKAGGGLLWLSEAEDLEAFLASVPFEDAPCIAGYHT